MLGVTRRHLVLAGLLPLIPPLLVERAAHAEEPPAAGPPKQVFLSLGDFTINLHDKDARFDFVVIGVTLDVAPKSANQLKDIMPRLKETLTRRLMALADRGALTPGQTDPVMLKSSLADALQKLDVDGVNEVLITRLLYG
jgi:flagellar basal body-associated protein FliL